MPVPINLLRSLLGVLGLFFAHMLGRAMVKTRREKVPKRILYTWILRTAVALGGVCYSGIDVVSILAIVLMAASFALGVRVALHPPAAENLTDTIFPDK